MDASAPGEHGQFDHAETIRQFAYFRLPPISEYIADPQERGLRAWGLVLESLAKIAEIDDWVGTTGQVARPLPILDSYIRYTFQRLRLEGKICTTPDGRFASFNTALLTPHAEEVVGLFQTNQMVGAQSWVFVRWATESDRTLLKNFPEPPPLPEYVSSVADLVFDWDRPLKLAYDHILVDNIERFPEHLALAPFKARQALDFAVVLAIKRARRNYKTIVPQWYPRLRESGAQFLMPLDLTGDHRADLVLVVSSVGEAYRGHTVLTLDMAYTNARLVARPDSDWLLPRAANMPATDEAFEGLAESPGETID